MLGGTYLALQNSRIQTILTQKLARQFSLKTNSNIRVGTVDIEFFNKIILKDVLIEGQNSDTIWYTESISAKIDFLKIRKHRVFINELTFKNNRISIERDSTNRFNISFILDLLNTEKDTTDIWKINCKKFEFLQLKLSYNDLGNNKVKNIFIQDMNLNVSDFTHFSDTTRFKINNLTLNDGKQLFLNNLSADFIATKESIEFKALNLKSKHSEINNSEITFGFEKDKKLEIDLQLSNSKISFLDLSEIFPTFRGMDQVIDFSGRIYGDLNDLKGKDLELQTGEYTHAIFDFYANGIKDPETMYLFLDLKQSETTFTDVTQIKLPSKMGIKKLKFHESFHEAGLLKFKGNFSGFLSDFVTFGTLQSEMGIIKTDISLIPKGKETVHFSGKISTSDFKIGEFIKTNILGNITFNGEVDGTYNSAKETVSGFFKGNASEVEINKYVYKNINIDGIYIDNMYDGLLEANDPNLQFTFQGRLDLNKEDSEFDFNLNLEKALPGNLNLSKFFPKAELSFKMKAKFSGNRLDNLKGLIVVDDGIYKNRNGEFSLKGIQLISFPNETSQTLSFTSDYFDIDLEGNYHFQSILNSFKKNIMHFLPAVKYKIPDNDPPNIFDYLVSVKTLDDLTAVLIPDFKFETPFLLYGKMNSEKSDFQLEGSIPGIQFKKVWFRNIFVGNKIIDNQYSSKFNFGEVLQKNGMSIYDVTVESKIANNVSNNVISWSNEEELVNSNLIKSRAVFSASETSNHATIQLDFSPSEIFIADTIWQFEHFTSIIDTSSIQINNFKIHNSTQSVSINGNISNNDSDLVSINFKDIDLSYLEKKINQKSSLKGIVNCSIGVSGVYNKPIILSDILVDSLEYNSHLVGNIKLSSSWDPENSVVNSTLEINKNNRQNLFAHGFYRPETDELNYDVEVDSLSLKLLESVIKNTLSDFQGIASGKVKVGGTLDKIALNGAIMASNAEVKIDYTQAVYHFSDSIYFQSDVILFDNIKFKDRYNNSGNLNGTLVHSNFQNITYNLILYSPKILALNTLARANEQFYGKIFANCRLTVLGQGLKVNLEGSATTLPGTDVYISMEYENDIEQYDFLEFVSTVEEEDKHEHFFTDKKKSEINLKFNVEATTDAKVQLIYNSQIGDVIKARGEGIILFEMDKDENIFLSGDYSVVEGDYLFTLKNVINKRFSIEQGGTIIWSGDPYNAIINLTAVYNLKAMLYDLMMQNYLIQGEDIYKRIPVECKILLSEELINPVINFEIDFPDEDESLIGVLQQYINTEEEMNKQILSLIVLGKFYTPEYLRGQYESQNPNTIGTTASEVFSNQLSNWLSQISTNVDVGFNYRPGNSLTNDEIELALSTQIFNDRVTLNGNIGNNVNPESSNSSQIVGDFDMKVKLVPSGKIQFKAFNRSNNNLIYETAPYTQGIGLSFKEEYNTINELAKKIGAIFKRKK